MIGTLLALIGTFLQEISQSSGKRMLEKHEISFSLFGIASYFIAMLIFLGFALASGAPIILAQAGLLTFFLRFIFEIIQSEIQFRALQYSDRTTFGFLRVLTIPLLLLVDVILGYTISTTQFIGVLIVTIALFGMFMGPRMRGRGATLALFSAVNAVVTISLYKYNISYFHSVAIEQFYITLLLVCYFMFRSFLLHGGVLFRMLITPKILLQSAGTGFGSMFASYAYQFGPASLILAVLRSSAVFWSFVSGAVYFNEKHIQRKLILSSLLMIAIFFIVR